MQLSALTDEELLRHAQVDHDPLVATGLETELLARYAKLVAANESDEEALNALEDIGVDPHSAAQRADLEKLLTLRNEFAYWDIRGLLELLSEHDLDNPDALRQVLVRDEAMRGLLDDLADPIAKLHQLANPAETPTTTEGAN